MKATIRVIAALAAVFAVVPATPAAEPPQCIYEDAQIHGRAIYTFTGGDNRAVTIVLGGFELRMGKHRLSGRDAVLWVNTRHARGAERHEMTVYVEGAAEAAGPEGVPVGDNAMIVHVLHEGRLSAVGPLRQRPLSDFPLYERAAAARQRAAGDAASVPTRPAPPTRPDETEGAPTTQPDTTPETDAAVLPPPRPVLPVQFRADTVNSRRLGDERVTIARGNVYVSQGHPEGELFLELRGQAAVIFSAKRTKSEHTRSPYVPEIEGFSGENLTGVYLYGDVVMSRGERYIRAEQLYYDLMTDRAYVPNAVLRTVQEQRDIPIYVRAAEMRALSSREMYFRDAEVTTSDFASPTWSVHADRAYMMDRAPYGKQGERLGERSWFARMWSTTFNVRGVPVAWSPWWRGEITEGHTALRTASAGMHGRFGAGVETEWHLFRLMGLVRPDGVRAYLDLDWYENGLIGGLRWHYDRQSGQRRYSGFGRIYGLTDGRGEDDFGDEREDIDAPKQRGRILWRHKEFLPKDWEVQAEVSYICDRNFLEQYWRDEFYAAKDQETLLYTKKQVDNWAFTALAKYRLNRFEAQNEAYPDVAFHLIGQPLLENLLSFFSESRAGLVRYRPANDSTMERSDVFLRVDTRQEVNWPLQFGPVHVVPYVVGRLTCWGDEPDIARGYDRDGEGFRAYGQVGVRASTTFWKLWPNVQSRLWDLHGLRHVITPEVAVFGGDTGGTSPNELFPLSPDIEEHLRRQNGMSAGVHTRLQTKRGPAGNRRLVDWMRLSVVAGVYDNGRDLSPADGRFFLYRPEYSQGRNHINLDYTWHISDGTTVLADMNYDVDSGQIGRAAAGVSVIRNPRMAYYVGTRIIPDIESAVGTVGARYKINRKYSVSAFQQYDFDFRGKRNLATRLAITRKFPRWYARFAFKFDQTAREDTFGLTVTLRPEGIPEVRLGGMRMDLLGSSDEN